MLNNHQSWVLWRKLRDNYKVVLTGLQASMPNIKELDDNACYAGENPTGKLSLITGQKVLKCKLIIHQVEERLPYLLFLVGFVNQDVKNLY